MERGIHLGLVEFVKNKSVLRTSLLLLSTCLLLGSLTGLFFDFFYGDANGVVAGFSMDTRLWSILRWVSFIILLGIGFSSKIRWIPNLALSILSLVLVGYLVEFVCGVILQVKATQAGPEIKGPTHSMQLDSTLGYKPEANRQLEGVKTRGQDTLYAIRYATNAHSLRITPLDDTTRKRTQFVQFFGCSMTFGEGVESHQTMPYYFGKLIPKYQPYNLAYSGYSPAQALARLESGNLPQMIEEKSGIGFFVYIPDHINRVVSTMSHYVYNEGNAPYYVLENGQLVRKGLFKTHRVQVNRLYELLLQSNLMKLFQIGLPFRLTSEHTELTAEVLHQAAATFEAQFPGSPFYVILYPTTTDNTEIKTRLVKKGVKVLDYSTLFNPKDRTFAIPFDEHPTPLANEVLIKRILQDLKLID